MHLCMSFLDFECKSYEDSFYYWFDPTHEFGVKAVDILNVSVYGLIN